MSEDNKAAVRGSARARVNAYNERLRRGLFLTERLTVDEKQFRSLVAWGKRHGVVIERFAGYGGRKKEGQDGSGTDTDSLR